MNIQIHQTERLLSNIDLEPIIAKALDSEEGLGWELSYANRVAREYIRYLTLCILYPNEAVVPSSEVDEFWHLHILDTLKYAEDCQTYIGSFLHHFPYFGMRGEEDARNLQLAWERSLQLYIQTFNESPDPIIWLKSNRCPNCGRIISNDMQFMYRPGIVNSTPL